MTTRLGDEDRRAVDLLLDQAVGSGHSAMYAQPQQDGFERRVKSVERLLNVLGSMPADEPAPDLADRTLERINQFQYGAMESQINSLDQSQPQPKHHT